MLVTLNDGEGVELLLAAWRISGGSQRGVTWPALAQMRGDNASAVRVRCSLSVCERESVENELRLWLCWLFRAGS